MTEQEWLLSDAPSDMIDWLSQSSCTVSGRKWRLIAAGFSLLCARTIKERQFSEAWHRDIDGAKPEYWNIETGVNAARAWIKRIDAENLHGAAADLIRDIVGIPHRPVLTFSDQYIAADIASRHPLVMSDFCLWCDPWRAWNGHAVERIAADIHANQTFDHLPILADALEDAGCEDRLILEHLRGRQPCICAWHLMQRDGIIRSAGHCSSCGNKGWVPLRGPHVRGCWALDLCLGKE